MSEKKEWSLIDSTYDSIAKFATSWERKILSRLSILFMSKWSAFPRKARRMVQKKLTNWQTSLVHHASVFVVVLSPMFPFMCTMEHTSIDLVPFAYFSVMAISIWQLRISKSDVILIDCAGASHCWLLPCKIMLLVSIASTRYHGGPSGLPFTAQDAVIPSDRMR